MPIKEESFRIGCGRYIEGAGYIEKIGEEVKRVGSSPLIVGGETALSLTREKIEKSVTGICDKYEFKEHKGTCNEDDAEIFADLAAKNGYDVIVGVGGGVICDFAKLVGYFAHLPVINIPTSSATCAAYTPLSVRYTREGKTVGTRHYENEVAAVIADTEIIAKQPVRLLLSGVFDALAKFVEIKQRFNGETKEYPMGLNYAYAMSEYSYNFLNDKTQKCIDDMEKGEITFDVENMIFTTIAATGVISGIARGSNQTALAHKFYTVTRTLFPESAKPYLHGEIVGVGLLLQNYFNGEEENNKELLRLMKKYNMPCKVEGIGADKSMETFEKYYDGILHSSAIDNPTEKDEKLLREALLYLWRI